MEYNHPEKVLSPHDYVKENTPLYDGGEAGCSISIIKDKNGHPNVGIRWNVSKNERKNSDKSKCVGMPQSHGNSVWFILPRAAWEYVPDIIRKENKENKNLVSMTEEKIQEAVNNLIINAIATPFDQSIAKVDTGALLSTL